MLAQVDHQPPFLVILSPNERIDAVYQLLHQPQFACVTHVQSLPLTLDSGRAKFLLGSTLNPSDLERAAVRNAKAVFILSDRSVNLRCNTADHGRLDDDRGKADRHTILRAWAINDFAPRVKLYIQVDCGSHFIVDSDR
jgi:hypothetical protein